MGSSGSKTGGDQSDYYREQEQERQDAVRQGTEAIDAIFDGSTYGADAVSTGAAYDPNLTYYNADGSVWTPTFADALAAVTQESTGWEGAIRGGEEWQTYNSASKWDALRNPQTTGTAQTDAASGVPSNWGDAVGDGLYTGTETSGGFDDAFYDDIRQSYIDYAMPQLEDQKADAARELTFALARSGQLEGSTRASQESELTKLYDLEAQNITDQALNYETESRAAVEDARADLVTLLQSTGDAAGAAQSATARAETLSQPTAYSPLTDLFASYTDALGKGVAADRAAALGWGNSRQVGSPTWYGTNSSSVKVT